MLSMIVIISSIMNINLMHKSRQITLVIKKKVIKNLGSICLGGKEGGKERRREKMFPFLWLERKGTGKLVGANFLLGPQIVLST